jgi:AAA15 family ATPase/GTPase
MIDTLIVKNFRCFESLEMRNFARVNIIVGENASGKTALLESLFFGAGGSPDMGFRLRAWRGGEMLLQLSRTNESYGTLWQDLFFDQDSNRRISVEIQGSPGNNYKVEVFYGGIESSRLPLNGGLHQKTRHFSD